MNLNTGLKVKIVDLFTLERRDIAELAHLYGKTGLQIESVLREALAARNRAQTNGDRATSVAAETNEPLLIPKQA